MGEVDKSLNLIDYYISTALDVLKDEQIKTNKFLSAYVMHEPIGPTFLIVPWNSPIWLTFKTAIPAIMGGNPVILKLSARVPLCAQLLDNLFN